jgi:hypothetical protein
MYPVLPQQMRGASMTTDKLSGATSLARQPTLFCSALGRMPPLTSGECDVHHGSWD